MSTKTQIIEQVQKEQAMSNARNLVTSVNKNCFEKCIPKPGPSLSSSEVTCTRACIEKYMDTWNTVSRAYVEKLRQEQERRGAGGGGLTLE